MKKLNEVRDVANQIDDVSNVANQLDDVRKIQKRARDKEYRLRKAGGSVESISAVSPRKPWAEVKNYSPTQLRTYTNSLNNFNKNSRYTATKSGDIIPTKMVKQITDLVKQRNKFVRKERKRIEAASPKEWLEKQRKRQGILKKDNNLGLLRPIDTSTMEKPSSWRSAQRRIKSLQRQRKRSYDYYRRIQRKNMMLMLKRMGYDYYAHVVRYMSNDKFDVLANVTPIWDEMSVEYADALNESMSTEEKGFVQWIMYANALDTKQGGSAEELSPVWKANVLKYHQKREKKYMEKVRKEMFAAWTKQD